MQIENLDTWCNIIKCLNLDVFGDKFIIDYLEKGKGSKKYLNRVFVLCKNKICNRKHTNIYEIKPEHSGSRKTSIDIGENIIGFLQFKKDKLEFYLLDEHGARENDLCTIEEDITNLFMTCDLFSENLFIEIAKKSLNFSTKIFKRAVKQEEILNYVLKRPQLFLHVDSKFIDKLTCCTSKEDFEQQEEVEGENNIFYKTIKNLYLDIITKVFKYKDICYYQEIDLIRRTCLGHYLIKELKKKIN